MTSITISKQVNRGLNEQQRQVLGAVLFDLLDGVTEADKQEWRAVWRAIMQSTPNEVFRFKFWICRDGVFHRRHMKLESAVFESQERFTNFERFRDFLKVGAGFVEWRVSRGKLVATPRSIAYDECDQAEMDRFHADAIAFLRTREAQKHLWPAVAAGIAEKGVESIFLEFDA